MTTEANATAPKAAPPTDAKNHGNRRTLVGKVTSAKMTKTVVVEVVRSVRHPVYGKYVRKRAKYKAHDETQQYREGDVVEIIEHRPLSRDKRWSVIRLVDRREQG